MLCSQTLKAFNKQKAERNMWFNSSISLSLCFIWLNWLKHLMGAPGGSWTQAKISVCWNITAVARGQRHCWGLTVRGGSAFVPQLSLHNITSSSHFFTSLLEIRRSNKLIRPCRPTINNSNLLWNKITHDYIMSGLNAHYYANNCHLIHFKSDVWDKTVDEWEIKWMLMKLMNEEQPLSNKTSEQ